MQRLTPREVKALLPDYGAVSNPLDFTAGYWGQEQLLTPMFTHMLREGYDQGLLVIDHPRPELGEEVGVPMAAMVRSLGAASRATGVPGTVCCVNPESMPEFMRRQVIEEGLLPLQGLHDGGPVLGHWADYGERRRAVARHGLPKPPYAVAPLAPDSGRVLDEVESKRRLGAHGLASPDGRVCAWDELAAAAADLRGPLALKAVSAALPHKTEAGAVALGLEGPEAVRQAAEEMAARVAAHSGLSIERFLLEPMVAGPVAELLVGIKRDPLFGLVLVVASGGILVELTRDAERLLLPAGAGDIERAIRRLKAFQLMAGFRGRPRGDLAAAVAAVQAVAAYAEAARDRILEIDVNPLMVLPEGQGAIAVDALIVERPDGGCPDRGEQGP